MNSLPRIFGSRHKDIVPPFCVCYDFGPDQKIMLLLIDVRGIELANVAKI